MSQENVEVVRALWAGLKQDPGEPWPPASRDELDRRLRLDLCDERIEIRNPAEFPAADEYHGHQGVRQWAAEVWEVFSRCTMSWRRSSKRTTAKRSSAFSAHTDSCVTHSSRWTSSGQPSGPSEKGRQSAVRDT